MTEFQKWFATRARNPDRITLEEAYQAGLQAKIEARVTGAQNALEESAVQTAARIMNIELIRERDALRAKIEQMEQQEPVAWYSKRYGFVYMSRQPSQFERGSILYLRNGAPAWRIEGSSKVALLDMASLPHGTVFYAIHGAQGE